MTEEPTVHSHRSYGSGLRTTLRHNSAAYGFSIMLTATFGITSTQHGQNARGMQVLLFAAGATAAFLIIDGIASRRFQLSGPSEPPLTSMVAGAMDALSILAGGRDRDRCFVRSGTGRLGCRRVRGDDGVPARRRCGRARRQVSGGPR